MMKPSMLSRATAVFFLVMAMLGCSRGDSSSSLQAVEVGNPQDSRPGKPNKLVPLRLVQVEIQPTQFEEISKVNFNLEQVSIWDGTLDGTKHPAQQSLGDGIVQLLFSPESRNILEFKVPETLLHNRAQLHLQFRFAAAKPGVVFVGDKQFDIASHDQPLNLQVDLPLQENDVQEPLWLSRTLTKANLFETQPTQVNSGQISVGTGNETSAGSVNPPRTQPMSAKQPVYKLRGSDSTATP